MMTMSYDLVFWCDESPGERDPQLVYEALLEDRQVVGLDDFEVPATLEALATRFPEIVHVANRAAVWEEATGAGVIEFAWSDQHLMATARGDVGKDEINAIIDICVDVGGARLYDPQIGQRFDSI